MGHAKELDFKAVQRGTKRQMGGVGAGRQVKEREAGEKTLKRKRRKGGGGRKKRNRQMEVKEIEISE